MPRQAPASVLLAPKYGPTPRGIFEQMNLPIPLREPFSFLVHPVSRASFFEHILELDVFTERELDLLWKAYDVAEREFDGLFRKSGERYFEHLRRATLILIIYLNVRDANMIAAMILHDIVEMRRRHWTLKRLTSVFNEEVASLVLWLTKLPRSRSLPRKAVIDEEYFMRLERAPREVILLKAADRLDNLLTLWAKSPRKVRQILYETETYILPLLHKYNILVEETEAVLAYIKAQLNKP